MIRPVESCSQSLAVVLTKLATDKKQQKTQQLFFTVQTINLGMELSRSWVFNEKK